MNEILVVLGLRRPCLGFKRISDLKEAAYIKKTIGFSPVLQKYPNLVNYNGLVESGRLVIISFYSSSSFYVFPSIAIFIHLSCNVASRNYEAGGLSKASDILSFPSKIPNFTAKFKAFAPKLPLSSVFSGIESSVLNFWNFKSPQ